MLFGRAALHHRRSLPPLPHRRRSLLVFLSLFVCKQGAQVAADSIDAVQQGLTLMILQTVRSWGTGWP